MSNKETISFTSDKRGLLGLDIPHRASHAGNTSNHVQDPLRDELDNMSRAAPLAASPQQNGVQKKYAPVPRPDLAKEPWHGVSKVLEQGDHTRNRAAGNDAVGDVTSKGSRSR